MKVSVIIPAAGQGKRFGSGENKVLQALGGKRVLDWSLSAFEGMEEVVEIVLVGNRKDLTSFREYSKRYKKLSVVEGGAERFDSVWEGLRAISKPSDLVLVHDAARPLISQNLILESLKKAMEFGGSVVAVPMTDTVKRSKDGKTVLETVPRDALFRTQTPQCFRREPYLRAYEKAKKEEFRPTDDASVAERYGMPVAIVLGNEENLKITTPADLAYAEFLLSRRR